MLVIDFSSETEEFELVGGVVVPKGSRVRSGVAYTFAWPKQDDSLALFKQLFGVKKRKQVVEEEDEVPVPIDSDSDSDADNVSEADGSSADESEAAESDGSD